MEMHHRKFAPKCDDQLPVIATVGRGPQGDSSYVEVVDPDTCTETYIKGWRVDEVTGEKIVDSEWMTKNINGGELKYQYNLRPYTNPRTFTMTFVYKRPGRCEWSWTTPAIPYIWTIDDDGNAQEQPDAIVGSGVATLFIRTAHDEEWNERLYYPEGTTRDDYNAPLPEEAWSATITFGKGGDIEVPDFDDIAKIIGVTKEDIFNILEDNSVTINGIEADNLIDYIDKCDARDMDHIHKDLGFNEPDHEDEGAFGVSPITEESYDTVKDYIDGADQALLDRIKQIEDMLKDLGFDDIPSGAKVAYGNINVYSGEESENHYIRTRSGASENHDIKAK